MNTMKKLCFSLCVLAYCLNSVSGHSWVACTDYRGSQDYYNPTQCFGYPRNWGNVASGSAFGEDRGFNFQAPDSGSQPCRDPLGSAPGYGYSTIYPMATYAPGSTVCLAWPSKNHVAATCTNQYIPDTALELYVSPSPTGNSDPTQQTFNQHLVQNWTQHANGVIDFKGFQHCPKFCENMDKSLCSQCFTVPSNLQAGKIYTFQWWWVFNAGTPAYTTCWEAKIAGGSNSGSGSSSTTAAGSSTTGSRSTTGSQPATTGSHQGSSTTGTVVPPPICGGSGSGSGSGTGLPNGKESVAITTAPFIIPSSGSFDVVVAYSALGSRTITVDVLDTKANPTWYGKGVTSVSAGSGTVTIHVTLSTSPTTGPNYVLRAWVVDSQYNSKPDPWTYTIAANDFSVSVGGSSAFYSQSYTACNDTTPCDNLCGGANEVQTCNCDETGHVTVLCKNTPAPVINSTESATSASTTSHSVSLLLLGAAAVAVYFL